MARSEPFGALLNCFTIWGLTVYLLFEAVSRILTPPKYFEPGIMLFTATFGVLANMAMAAIINGPGILITMVKFPFMSKEEKDNLMVEHEGENLNIRTVMAHINGDLAYSVGVLLAAIGININNDWLILDPLLTILFSYVVLHITLPIFRDSTKAIMEANPDEDKYDILSRETVRNGSPFVRPPAVADSGLVKTGVRRPAKGWLGESGGARFPHSNLPFAWLAFLRSLFSLSSRD